eukprot:6924770-Prymnesium_polylepis.1
MRGAWSVSTRTRARGLRACPQLEVLVVLCAWPALSILTSFLLDAYSTLLEPNPHPLLPSPASPASVASPAAVAASQAAASPVSPVAVTPTADVPSKAASTLAD